VMARLQYHFQKLATKLTRKHWSITVQMNLGSFTELQGTRARDQ
jgi:hypothetical protein